MVPAFYDQVVAKLVVEPNTGKRNLEISLDIVREICTGQFLHCKLSAISMTLLAHVLVKMCV